MQEFDSIKMLIEWFQGTVEMSLFENEMNVQLLMMMITMIIVIIIL